MSNINLPVAELKPALIGLGKIIAKRTTLPVLGMIKLERTKDGWITLTGTDLETFVSVRLEQPAEGEPVSILVAHEDLNRITKRCQKEETISVEKAKVDKALVKYPIGSQTAEEHVESLATEEYPPMPRIKSEPVPLSNDIRSSLLDAFECASIDSTRIILNGAYIDVSKPSCHQIVGTDGRHLFASNSFRLPLAESLIIPSHKFLGWKEFNSDGEWQLRVQKPENKNDRGLLQISSRRWRFIIHQIEGMYPNWRQVIPSPDQFNTTVEFEAAAAKDLVQTISQLPSTDKINHRLGIEVIGRKVSFIGRTDEKPVKVEVMEAVAKGKDVIIYLNRDFLTKALSFGLCRMQIIDGLSPARFSDDAGREMIVMPIRPDGPAQTPVTASKTSATPAPEPNGKGEAAPVHSEASTSTERSNMPKATAATNGNGHTNGHAAETKASVETALEKIETIRGSYREAIQGLNALSDILKQVQRDQKTSQREVQSVRSTLEKLQTVRI